MVTAGATGICQPTWRFRVAYWRGTGLSGPIEVGDCPVTIVGDRDGSRMRAVPVYTNELVDWTSVAGADRLRELTAVRTVPVATEVATH